MEESKPVGRRHGGYMVALEGIDGSGKSTQAALLQQRLEEAGWQVWLTREPTDGHIGRLIRTVLRGESTLNEAALTALYAADRLDHLKRENGILDRLRSAEIVICDRYYLSSYAYHADVVDLEWIVALNSLAVELCTPELTVFLDVEPETALKRISGLRERAERYEYLNKLQHVRDAYNKAFASKNTPGHLVPIDGARDEAAVAEDIWRAFSAHVAEKASAIGEADIPEEPWWK